MTLAPGTRLGVYEVLSPLGAGGMGEVWRARDTRLNRDVAIKVLPERVAGDETRLARFEREARFLASLNHPGIAAVYGLEEAGGAPYIVMELVPGETLTERLATGALPVPEALALARQIAEALEAAHEKGVVHRDLKPGNIKVTPEGKVKVLDLGLAKAFDVKPPSDEDLSRSPTVVLEETRPGVILGTAEFMSPEQARGKAVDKRTDIWAFGCVLFEMLSGRRAFTGETVSDVLAAILSAEPDWEALPGTTPPRVRDLLGRCLQKDANRRLRDIGDARLELEETHAARTGPQPAAGRRKASAKLAALAATLAALAVVSLWLFSRAAEPGEHAPAKSTDRRYVAVLFQDLTDRQNGQALADGLAETVSALFAKVPGIQVVTPAVATAAYRKDPDPYRVARNVGANLVVRGTVQRAGERVRITYSVLNVARGEQLAADTVDGLASDLFGLQDQVFERIAGDLELRPHGIARAAPPDLAKAANKEPYFQALGLLQRYEREDSVNAALRLLQELALQEPRSALVYAALARAYLYKFNLTSERDLVKKAEAAAGRARALDPNLPEVDITQGEIRNRTGRAPEAIAAFQRALAGNPSSAPALLGLADAYEDSGNLEEAERAYRRAIAILPAYWGGYNRLGSFYFRHGRTEKAVEMFRQVVRLTPDNARGHSSLGAAYQTLGRFDEARLAYGRSITIEPTSDAYSNLGVLEYYLGRYRASAEAIEKAVAMTPRNYLLWANLGDAYRWIPGEASRANAALDKAIGLGQREIEVNPKNALAHATLAICLAKRGRHTDAARHILGALRLDPGNTNTLSQAAVIANLAGRESEVLARIREALQAGAGADSFARDPELANLRDNAAFQDLVGKKGRASS